MEYVGTWHVVHLEAWCFRGFGVRQIDADVGLFADSFCELRKAT